MTKKRVILTTADGSNTLYIPELNEHYHSKHGALQESKHVFIASGLDTLKESGSEIHLFEVGLGTGLNARLSLAWAMQNEIKVNYHSLEKYPLNTKEGIQLNYSEVFKGDEQDCLQGYLFDGDFNVGQKVNDVFTLTKYTDDLHSFEIDLSFDLIYFDAFGPRVQPDLWEMGVFKKMYRFLNIGGVLVTYCAKGQVRRDMEACGFKVERLPGPPGKREMLRATKQ